MTANELTAAGTLAAVAVAVGGLITSLWISSQDRRRADQQAVDDRKAARMMAAQDRQIARDTEQRRHVVSLLLELGREIGRVTAYASMPQAGEAAQQIRLLLLALPAECAVTARGKYRVLNGSPPAVVPGYIGEKLQAIHVAHIQPAEYSADNMYTEIRYDIDHYYVDGRIARLEDADTTFNGSM